jgi:hypothetical protein
MSELHRTLTEEVFYAPHPPRKASSEYRRTHHRLIVDLDQPCWICGIRHSDWLNLPKEIQPHWQLETHHDELEWASQFGIDLSKFSADHPDVTDQVALTRWVDSEDNMRVLCATHHRAGRTGIHSITGPVWKLQRFQGEDPKKAHQYIPQTNWHLLVPDAPSKVAPVLERRYELTA